MRILRCCSKVDSFYRCLKTACIGRWKTMAEWPRFLRSVQGSYFPQVSCFISGQSTPFCPRLIIRLSILALLVNLKWVHQHISWKLSIPEDVMNSSSINAIFKEIFVYLFGTCTWKKYTTLSCGVKYQCDSRCGFVCVRRINRWLQMAQLLPPHSSTKVSQV